MDEMNNSGNLPETENADNTTSNNTIDNTISNSQTDNTVSDIPQNNTNSNIPPQRDVIDVIDNIDTSKGYDPFAEQDFSSPYHMPPRQAQKPYNMGYNNGYNPNMQNNPYAAGYPQNSFNQQNGFNPQNNFYSQQGYNQQQPYPRQNGYNNQQAGYNPPPAYNQQNMNMGYTSGGYTASSPAYEYNTGSPEIKPKRLSNGWIAAIIIVIAAIFIGVLAILAFTDSGTSDIGSEAVGGQDNASGGSGTVVEIPIQPKPALESQYYQDEETGLLTTTGVAKRVSPSVVDVVIFKDTTLYPHSQGSGIIISPDGYIVTNAHVVNEANAGVKVVLDDDSEYEAKIIGQDSKTDIAVLKIEAENLTAADLGDSSQLELGEMVVAIGNAGGYSGTITVGYVSGIDREVSAGTGGDTMTCIQTDAAMSPGVSGGALINMYGQVVGITSSKYQSTALDEGIGFAITTQFAKPIIEDIISQGYISGRVRVGITYTPLDDTTAEAYGVRRGIYVQTIAEECDISNTELKAGDIITELNGVEIYSASTIKQALEGTQPGDRITAHVYRQGITENETTEFDIEFELMQDTNLS
ncbi:MAG: trypsin-like peptidase domain-containing protein [Oscillospiraceae bacterium]|nr:trypsin-like peptidase domain-containing protein [Oscillospiraceae bacterium]